MPWKLTRRKFLWTQAVAVAAVSAGHTAEKPVAPAADPNLLAKLGGAKSVRTRPAKWVRWDGREQAQLAAAVEQASLFYWNGRAANRQTALFIERFQRVCPVPHVVTCSSGTSAVQIAVAAAGIGPGDEAITSPVTDLGTVSGVLFQQGVPVFADLGAETHNLDPVAVERLITPRTKAIIAVHLAGNPCDVDALRALADRRGLILIEDCAQAWGAKSRGRPVGTVGHIACFSLMGSKHICTGDGGVVASNDPRLGPALLKFADKGNDRLDPKFTWDQTAVLAGNHRMSELQAAFGAVQLERLEGIASKRAALGDRLRAGLAGIAGVTPPAVAAGDRATYWFFYFRLELARLTCTRQEFADALRAEGVACAAGYIPVPLYRLPVFSRHAFFAGRWPVKELRLTDMDYGRVSCPEAEAMLATGIHCTLNEAMDEVLIDETAAAVRKVARHYAR
jgi:dTDP-4-amino-4,6-dideoxygalactose transaminase